VLRCCACGTEHCVNVERCAPQELAYMIRSQRDCRMSLFLVNELAVDELAERPMCVTERSGLFASFSRLWK
jgi:hypothetical protein